MLFVYIGALIAGAGTILLQVILAAGHADVDAHAGDVHDGDHDAGAWSVLLSTRFWTFLLLAFGLVGTMLTAFGLAGFGLALGLAVGSGILAGLFAALTLRALKRTQATTNASIDDAVGMLARVVVPCAKGRIGKVRVELKGQAVDLMAMTSEHELAAGVEVVVEEVNGGVARVVKAPEV